MCLLLRVAPMRIPSASSQCRMKFLRCHHYSKSTLSLVLGARLGSAPFGQVGTIGRPERRLKDLKHLGCVGGQKAQLSCRFSLSGGPCPLFAPLGGVMNLHCFVAFAWRSCRYVWSLALIICSGGLSVFGLNWSSYKKTTLFLTSPPASANNKRLNMRKGRSASLRCSMKLNYEQLASTWQS